MRQTIVQTLTLDKADIVRMKSGEKIEINLPSNNLLIIEMNQTNKYRATNPESSSPGNRLVSAKAVLAELIKDHAQKPKAIATTLDTTPKRVSQRINYLYKHGKVVKSPTGWIVKMGAIKKMGALKNGHKA